MRSSGAAKALASAYLGARDQLGPVTREELARRLQDGDPLVVLVCGRPPSTPPGWPSPAPDHGRALVPAKFPDGPVTVMCAHGERATGQALARS
jgi:hypothetical protein